MQNHYPWWKNLLLFLLFVACLIYAAPNLFHDDPAIQISPRGSNVISVATKGEVINVLKNSQIPYLRIQQNQTGLLVRFGDGSSQLKARDLLSRKLGDSYIVALNLASRTPAWLTSIGANPMKLGLDLRGGVYFLIKVDTDELVSSHEKSDMHSVVESLRDQGIRYAGISRLRGAHGFVLHFREASNLSKAYDYIEDRFPDYRWTKIAVKNQLAIQAVLTRVALTKVINYAVEQAMNTLNNRVNALGVSEALVQRQGQDHISVELPGIQDTARAKNIIGKVATLRFQMVDENHDVDSAMAGDVPIGSKIYMQHGQPVLLKDRVILRGNAVTYASAAFDQSGRPSVNVRLGGSGDVGLFNRVTGENVGKAMAVVYVETKGVPKIINGKKVTVFKKSEEVISVATIQSALGNNFQITGLESVKYAQNLALLLRSGALLAPMQIVQERTIGPSLGLANIHMGLLSIIVGFLAVVLFMLFYYHLFGLFADMALLLNLIFIVAVFSLMGVTMTLPGIAAMVLTVGMAVDANVLIYERIREELRLGITPQAAIQLGYERAFTTIVDSNVTTLIVALVLFALGSGSVKGFAVTLIVGLLTSMVTSIVYTRAVVNWIYGNRSVKSLSIGIKNSK
ncbi:MAG: protein translocase subunit SecD [Gammaproteobacteria bacterium]|nr:protein translocase subunit SecD [Gammaproteobacteria bacterium]